MRRLAGGLAAIVLLASVTPLAAAELNIYSERHYQTDEQLYEGFTKATGITLNRIEGKGDELIERIKSEGANSPADVLITVDVGRLWRADEAGLFQPIESDVLQAAVPASLRHPDGHWFGFSMRARLIFYSKDLVQPGEVKDYEDLADPKWKGKVCIRSSSNVYNLSLLGSLIEAHGEAGATDWAKGVVANFAHDPQGGDTDQLRGVAAGECALGVANSYYFARLLADPEEKAVTDKIGWVFPNQDGRGTHVNISGVGVLANAPHKEEAVKFLEYLASESAQRYFADGNNEYPVVKGIAPNSTVQALGAFKADEINVASYGENQPLAQKIFDRAGWK